MAKDFKGLTPSTYLEALALAEDQKTRAEIQNLAEQLQRWHDWVIQHDLEPLAYEEAAKVYKEAEEAVKPEVLEAWSGRRDSPMERLAFQTSLAWKALARLEALGYQVFPYTTLVSPIVDEEDRAPAERWAICKVRENGIKPPPYPLKLAEGEANLLNIHRVLSMMPAQTIDRAARGPKSWRYPVDEPPRYEDPRNAHVVEYYTKGVPLEMLRESIERLNPRSADVWRLVTAASLEAWQDGQLEPSSVWVDVRQLCEAMGYKKATHGGYKPEHVSEAARALTDLQNFHIVIPFGAKTFPADPKTGKRRATKAEARRKYAVLMVAATDEVRVLSSGETFPMRWLVRPGEWIKGYPKQFAPLYRALVELPATGVNVWAKAIGTELSWQYRQNGGEPKTIKVRTLLEQAALLDDLLSEPRNRGRARNNLENALDVLQQEGVCKSWEYHPGDIDAVEATGRRGWFDVWLAARVTVTPPDQIAGALNSVKERALETRSKEKLLEAKAQARRNASRAKKAKA